jgi:hypothetical protein
MKKATRSLGSHFKDFKKEKQMLKSFSRLLRKRKYMKKRQEAFKVILKILEGTTKIERFLSVIENKETYEESDKKLEKSF